MGEGRELVFAEGAHTGTPASLISLSATGWSGMRTATVSKPAVTMSGTTGFLGITSVRAPGMSASISLRESSSTTATASI